jgi:hypothetical protein
MGKRQIKRPLGATLIFLDIDGVLLPFGDGSANLSSASPSALFPDECLRNLSLILAGVKNIELCLSSTWRANPNFVSQIIDDFKRFAKENGGGPLAKADFKWMTSTTKFDTRQREIHDFLLKLPKEDLDAWVCLDDEDVLNGPECLELRPFFEGHVVQTESPEGLTLTLILTLTPTLHLP